MVDDKIRKIEPEQYPDAYKRVILTQMDNVSYMLGTCNLPDDVKEILIYALRGYHNYLAIEQAGALYVDTEILAKMTREGLQDLQGMVDQYYT